MQRFPWSITKSIIIHITILGNSFCMWIAHLCWTTVRFLSLQILQNLIRGRCFVLYRCRSHLWLCLVLSQPVGKCLISRGILYLRINITWIYLNCIRRIHDGTTYRICGSQHVTTSFHGSLAFPHHCYHRTGCHVLDKRWEKWLATQIGIMLL